MPATGAVREGGAVVKNAHMPRAGFRADPAHRQQVGLAHATPAGRQTALCGVHTAYFGGLWPAPGQPWTQPYSRCPTCAHRLYATDRL